jgi:hypothetical protein
MVWIAASSKKLLAIAKVASSSSGMTRGSACAHTVFDEESSGVAARDARVEPEHDVDTARVMMAREE